MAKDEKAIKEKAAEEAKNKLFTENADVLPLIDEYHKTRSEFNLNRHYYEFMKSITEKPTE